MSRQREAKRKRSPLPGLKRIGVGIGVVLAIMICSLLFAPSPERRAAMTATAIARTVAAGDVVQPPSASETPSVTIADTPVGDTTVEPRRATQFAQLTALAVVNPTAAISETPGAPAAAPGRTQAAPETWYTIRVANLRACPRIDCVQVAQIGAAQPVTVIGWVQGENYQGNDIWRRVLYNGAEVYVNSALVASSRPMSTLPPVVIATQPPVIAPPVASVSCPSLNYTCSQLTCQQAQACLAAGNGGLDRDGDGVPCESICPGG